MQTLEFTRAIKEIIQDLQVRELISLVQPWINPTTPNTSIPDASKDKFSSLLLQSNAGYERLLRRPITRPILEKLRIGELYEPNRTRMMMTLLSTAANTNQVSANVQAHPLFYSLYAQLLSLVRVEEATRELLEDAKTGQIDPSQGILELELIEYHDELGISPKRLQVFVSSIVDLHTNLSRVYGIQDDRVTFKYFDSGSGLRVGIACAKAIAETMSNVISQWFDKIRFWRFDTFEKKMNSISQSLDVVEKLHQVVETGAMTQDEGENLKYRILRDVDTLLGIGATVPLGETATIDQKQLLTEMRDTKLLGTGNPNEQNGEPPTQR